MQKKIFLEKEADNWYLRNKASLESVAEIDKVLERLDALEISPNSVLEIGCGNGWRLKEINKRYGSDCYGIEPSAIAVKDAIKNKINIVQGTAEKLNFMDRQFDLIIYGSCLYLCDREDLFTIAAQANRVLKENGHIVIVDFYSPNPYKKKYHHFEGIYSYKMDYRNLFLWNPSYTCIDFVIFSHDLTTDLTNRDNWVGVSILLKSEKNAYRTVE